MELCPPRNSLLSVRPKHWLTGISLKNVVANVVQEQSHVMEDGDGNAGPAGKVIFPDLILL